MKKPVQAASSQRKRYTLLLCPANCTFFMQLSIIEDENLILVATVNVLFCMSTREIMRRKRHKISGNAGHFLTT